MAKKFTKLFVGDTIVTSGTRVFKKLTTEETTTNQFILADGSALVTSDGNNFIINNTEE